MSSTHIDKTKEGFRFRENSIHLGLSPLFSFQSGAEQVEFLLPLVAGLCNNHNNLDSISTLNSSRSDWVLLCGSNKLSKLSVLREKDAHVEWTLNSPVIHRYYKHIESHTANKRCSYESLPTTSEERC